MITKNDELPLEREHFKHVDYGCKIPDFRILQGDCMERLNEIEDNSIDTIFADPPYFLSNGGISVHSGKQVCVDKGDWDKGGTPEYIYTSSIAVGWNYADQNSKTMAQFGLVARTIIFT